MKYYRYLFLNCLLVFYSMVSADIHDQLIVAVSQGDLIKIESVLKQGAFVDTYVQGGGTSLLRACFKGNLDMVKLLLRYGANVNYTDRARRTPVAVAAMNGHSNITQYFIDNKIPLVAPGQPGQIVLSAAVTGNDLNMLKVLELGGQDIAALSWSDSTLIHICANRGKCSLDMLSFLIDKNIDINRLNKLGVTAIHLAAEKGRADIVKKLLDHKAKIGGNKSGLDSALTVAIKNNHLDIVKLLLKTGKFDTEQVEVVNALFVSVKKSKNKLGEITKLIMNADYVSAIEGKYSKQFLKLAIVNNNIELFELFAKNRRDLNMPLKGKLTTLEVVLRNKRYQMVGSYIKYSENSTTEEIKKILPEIAKHIDDYELLKLLTAKGFNLSFKDDKKRTALWYAAQLGNANALRYYIETTRKTINEVDKFKISPLMAAASNKNIHGVKLLIKHQANVNLKDSDKYTALTYAVKKKQNEIVQLLIKANADANHQLKHGTKLLTLAFKSKNKGVIKSLIKAGANINYTDPREGAPLLMAVEYKMPEVVSLLLKKSVKVDEASTRYGSILTPLSLAFNSGQLKIAQQLLSAGAKVNNNRDTASFVFKAIKADDYKLLDLLLEKGASANSKYSKEGYLGVVETLINFAVANNKKRALRKLLQKGGNPNLWDSGGHNAAFHIMDEETLTLLLKHGMDINHISKAQATVLVSAVSTNNLDYVKLLLKNNADPNIGVTKKGELALMVAVTQGNKEIVKLLLDHNADPVKRSPTVWYSAKKSALDLAVEKGDKAILEMLKAKVRN